MELYSKSYSKIAKKAKAYLQEEENEEEDGPLERLPPPDKQALNFLASKPLKRIEWYRYFDIHLPEEMPQKKLKTEANSSSSPLENPAKISPSTVDPAFQIHRGESDESRSMDMISMPKKVGEPATLVSYHHNHPNHHQHPGINIHNIQNIQQNIQNIQNIQQNIQSIQTIQQNIQRQNMPNLHGIQTIQGIQGIQNIQGIQTPIFIGLVQQNHQGDNNLNNILQARQLIGNGGIINGGSMPIQTMQTMQVHPNGGAISIISHNPYQMNPMNQMNQMNQINGNGNSILGLIQNNGGLGKQLQNPSLVFQMQDKSFDENFKLSEACNMAILK
jgi:hypothetical protein